MLVEYWHFCTTDVVVFIELRCVHHGASASQLYEHSVVFRLFLFLLHFTGSTPKELYRMK